MPRLPNDMREMLDASGVDWRIETGTRHFKLVVGGKLAAILPKGKNMRKSAMSDRAHKNALAQVRRAINGASQ